MQGRRYWIEYGNLRVLAAAPQLTSTEEEQRFHRDGFVKVTTGAVGTEIKWSVFSPCFSSLFTTIEWLPSARGPFVLRYYLSGWFEEVHSLASAAIHRLEEIIAKSEVHISKRTFVREMELTKDKTPTLLLESFQRASPIADYVVECVHDEHSNQFRVEHIGAKSVMARIYGTLLASYPCKNGNSYDRTVSEAYNQVITTGRPRYDHVLASLYTPDNSQHWLPYHRVIFPNSGKGNPRSVRIMAEVAQVGIRII